MLMKNSRQISSFKKVIFSLLDACKTASLIEIVPKRRWWPSFDVPLIAGKFLTSSYFSTLVDDRRGCHRVEPARSVSPVDPVVALLAPGGAPGVLHDPVWEGALEQRPVVHAWRAIKTYIF